MHRQAERGCEARRRGSPEAQAAVFRGTHPRPLTPPAARSIPSGRPVLCTPQTAVTRRPPGRGSGQLWGRRAGDGAPTQASA